MTLPSERLNTVGLETTAIDMSTPITSLVDAENRLTFLDRVDLVMRLKRGEIYKTIRDKRLYRQHGYETFDDWVRYSESHKGGTINKVRVLLALYEIFVESLSLDPIVLQERGISYTALRVILPYVRQGWDPDTGELTIINKNDILEYLDAATALSTEELKGYIDGIRRPGTNRSMIRFKRIDLVGEIILVQVEAVDDLVGARDAGIWHLTLRCYRVLKESLERGGRLILEPGVEPPRLHQMGM